jgi:DNA-binding PadR family transcriptional regulator
MFKTSTSDKEKMHYLINELTEKINELTEKIAILEESNKKLSNKIDHNTNKIMMELNKIDSTLKPKNKIPQIMDKIIETLEHQDELTTTDLMRVLGVTSTGQFYTALKKLERTGKITTYQWGRKRMVRLSGSSINKIQDLVDL